jgi:hypothetical protein
MSTKPKQRVARLFFRNKVTALEETFRGQKLHGRRRTRHRNGQIATEEFYADGLLHGVVRQWNEQGKLLGSFRMDHGTGTQKSWHGNGRLNQEFSTVDGRFCGRSRMWLRDGTLISDQILLFNQNVSPGQYRRAAAKDPRLPRLRGRIGKPPPNNQAKQNRIHRVFVSSLLSRRNRSEARIWLQADDQTGRSLGRFKRAAEALKFVTELYQAGAIGSDFAGHLPEQARRSVRRQYARETSEGCEAAQSDSHRMRRFAEKKSLCLFAGQGRRRKPSVFIAGLIG